MKIFAPTNWPGRWPGCCVAVNGYAELISKGLTILADPGASTSVTASGFDEPSCSPVCLGSPGTGDGCTPSPALCEICTFLRSWKASLRLLRRLLFVLPNQFPVSPWLSQLQLSQSHWSDSFAMTLASSSLWASTTMKPSLLCVCVACTPYSYFILLLLVVGGTAEAMPPCSWSSSSEISTSRLVIAT